MRMAQEDILRIREIAAEKGKEFTPQEVMDIFQKIKPNLKIDKGPGAVTLSRQSRQSNGNIGPSGFTSSSEGS